MDKQFANKQYRRDNKDYLHIQMGEKLKHKEYEKIERLEQAEMWEKDAEIYAEQENKALHDLKKMNMDHVRVLREQMSNKQYTKKKE